MAAPRDSDLPVFTYHRQTVKYTGPTALGVAGTAVGFNGTQPNGSAVPVYGILEFDAATGQDVTISVAGICQVISGGAISIGDALTFSALGPAFSTGAGNQIFGRALSAARIDRADRNARGIHIVRIAECLAPGKWKL